MKLNHFHSFLAIKSTGYMYRYRSMEYYYKMKTFEKLVTGFIHEIPRTSGFTLLASVSCLLAMDLSVYSAFSRTKSCYVDVGLFNNLREKPDTRIG